MKYLTDKQVILLNALMIERYTPNERKGVKNVGLLQSALARPKQSAFGQEAYPTIWEKASALLASLSQNHAFHNANKRTGFASMKQFLWINGYNLVVDQKEAEDFTVMVVTEKPSIEEIAEWIKTNSIKR
jgi:death on curing protein